MSFSEGGAARWIAAMLLLTVATQLFYIGIVSNAGEDTVLRPATWLVELAAYAVVAVAGLALAARAPTGALAWSAIAVSGLLNMLQVGVGLSMFGPAQEASEAVPQLLQAVLSGAFFLYFLAKVLLGLAAIGFGIGAIARAGIGKVLGVLAAIAGAVAVPLNILALATGMDWTFPAGAAGTAAAALLAGVLLLRAGRPSTAGAQG